MLGRILGQNASGIAILSGMLIAIWMMGFYFGTQTLPAPPAPPAAPRTDAEIRADAIHRCSSSLINALNRRQPEVEALTNINEQCRRIYDGRQTS